MMKSRTKGGGAVSFNMTPMIDIVFNLIIFFMLMSQFIEMSTENVQLPPAVMADPMRPELPKYTQVVVNVVPYKDQGRRATKVIINHNTVVSFIEGVEQKENHMDPLITLLTEAQRNAPLGKPVNVILRADDKVPYEDVASVMIATAMADIKYWWVQARPPEKGEEEDVGKVGRLNP